MVIDTSALIAIFFDEPEAERFASLMDATATRLVSAVSWVETSIVVRQRLGDEAEARVIRELEAAGLEIVGVEARHAELAREAFRIYGRGRHAAALNFGDCFSYALARARDLPLLFKGEDFSRTDIDSAAW